MPEACIEDLKTGDDIRKAKETALGEALKNARGSDYENLVKDIENVQEKARKAYVRLYERVGEDIGLNFLEKLDYMDHKSRHGSSEADKLIETSHGKYSSAQVELKRLQDEKKRIQQMQRDKDREYLKSELPTGAMESVAGDSSSGFALGKPGAKTTIGDLFRKYNI